MTFDRYVPALGCSFFFFFLDFHPWLDQTYITFNMQITAIEHVEHLVLLVNTNLLMLNYYIE